MKYVIDSSVAFKWSVKEVDSDKADAILTDFLMGIHELHAPDFYPVELAHSITRAGTPTPNHAGRGSEDLCRSTRHDANAAFIIAGPPSCCLRNFIEDAHRCL